MVLLLVFQTMKNRPSLLIASIFLFGFSFLMTSCGSDSKEAKGTEDPKTEEQAKEELGQKEPRTEKSEKTSPYWKKPHSNIQIRSIQKVVEVTLDKYGLKPRFLRDDNDVKAFLKDHQGKNVVVDTLSNAEEAGEIMCHVYLADSTTLMVSRNMWELRPGNTGDEDPPVHLFNLDGWQIYARGGTENMGIWRGDTYYVRINNKEYKSNLEQVDALFKLSKYTKRLLQLRAQRTSPQTKSKK